MERFICGYIIGEIFMKLDYTISIRINQADYNSLEELQKLLFLDNASETIRQLIRRTKIDPKEQWENVL